MWRPTHIQLPDQLSVVLAATLVVVPLLGLVFGLDRLDSAQTSLDEALEDRQWLVDMLEREGPTLTGTPDSPATPVFETGPFSLTKLQSGIASMGLEDTLTTLREQESGSRIALRFEQAPFDAFSRWLSSLEGDRSIKITGFSVVPEDTKGLVSADVTLEPVP